MYQIIWHEQETVKSREAVQQSQALHKGAKGWFREAHVILENGEKYAVVIYQLPLNDDKMIDEKIERSWSYINGRLSELEVLALQSILRRKMRIYILVEKTLVLLLLKEGQRMNASSG